MGVGQSSAVQLSVSLTFKELHFSASSNTFLQSDEKIWDGTGDAKHIEVEGFLKTEGAASLGLSTDAMSTAIDVDGSVSEWKLCTVACEMKHTSEMLFLLGYL